MPIYRGNHKYLKFRPNILCSLLLLLCVAMSQTLYAQDRLPERAVSDIQSEGGGAVPADTAVASAVSEKRRCAKCSALVALKTNLLFDAAIVPNIGVEVVLGHQFSASFDWYYTWFKSDTHHRYWQCYGGYLTLRRYLGDWKRGKGELTGHHVGAYVSALTYDVEWGHRGYQGADFGFGAGVEYGYSTTLNHRLRLGFTLGVGFQDGTYKEYDPIDNHYVWNSTHKRHWWGPTKAEVSLKWLFWK